MLNTAVRVLLTVCMSVAPGYACAGGALNATAHADTFISPAIVAILGSNPYPVDYAPSSSLALIVAQGNNTGGAYLSVSTDLPANHAPYAILNASLCQYSAALDHNNYSGLLAAGQVLSVPVGVGGCGALTSGTPPGVLTSAITSTNSGDGGTGWGVEFVLSASYKGLDTTADSWDSAALAGFYLAMENQHPTWNVFDIKGAFRQSAGNWNTGYNAANFGFGTFNYDAATAIADTGSIFLQGPGLQVANHTIYATVTLYPFRQTRRTVELLYSVNASYSWPVKNEYSAADLAASGGTLLFASNGTDITPVYTFAPAASGTVTFVAFTTDGSGHYSRVEPYSAVSATLSAGVCTP